MGDWINEGSNDHVPCQCHIVQESPLHDIWHQKLFHLEIQFCILCQSNFLCFYYICIIFSLFSLFLLGFLVLLVIWFYVFGFVLFVWNFNFWRSNAMREVSLCIMVRLLHCDMGVTSLKHRNSLSVHEGVATYIWPSYAVVGALMHQATFYKE